MNDIETRDTGTKNDNSSEFNLSVKSHKRKRSFDDENLELEESREEISGGILKKAKTQSFSESLERFRFAHAGSNNEYRKTDVVKNSDTDNGLLKSAVETITLENGLRNRRVNVTKKSTLKASVKKSTFKKKNEVDPALLQGFQITFARIRMPSLSDSIQVLLLLLKDTHLLHLAIDFGKCLIKANFWREMPNSRTLTIKIYLLMV